jgi:hypothetical protein
MRRSAGVILLVWLAIEIWAGSRIPHRIARGPNPIFLFIWLSVGIKLIILLVLAMLDLLSTRHYAQRKRRSMLLERLILLRDARRHRVGRHARYPGEADRDPD